MDIAMVPRIENQPMSIPGEQVGDSVFKAFLPATRFLLLLEMQLSPAGQQQRTQLSSRGCELSWGDQRHAQEVSLISH
ncbi:hypothetical protein [Amycolatopsis speibonae]|uniref:Uncharacterized protein n=1 Tax=Amycolatopsis speibonae TaxID=1450224 RepID=A0ABV7P0P2_9PSEU